MAVILSRFCSMASQPERLIAARRRSPPEASAFSLAVPPLALVDGEAPEHIPRTAIAVLL